MGRPARLPGAGRAFVGSGANPRRRLLERWQPDHEPRPATSAVLDGDRAPMTVDDAAADRQAKPEPRALAAIGGLAARKRLEDPRPQLGRYAGAAILDGDLRSGGDADR